MDITCTQLPQPGQKVHLEVGMEFSSFHTAKLWIMAYAEQEHFVVIKGRLRRGKEGKLKKRTYQCDRAGRYQGQSSTSQEKQRRKRSKKCNCQWHANVSKKGAVVQITTIVNKHNHECDAATNKFACSNRHLTEDMKESIHYFTVHGHLDVGAQMALLKGKFPDRYICVTFNYIGFFNNCVFTFPLWLITDIYIIVML